MNRTFDPKSLCVTALALAILTTILWSFRRFRWRRSPFPLPPGPRGYPLVGNLFDIPSHQSQSWLTLAKWGEIYGDVCSVAVLGQPMIIINSAKIASDMLRAKSSIYSDRPRFVMTGELGGWNQAIGVSPYNNRWRHMRRLFHNAIGTPASNKRFNSSKEFEARRLLRNVLAKPEKLLDHLRLTAAATMLRDTYGYEVVDEEHDPMVAIANEALDEFSRAAAPPYNLVEFLPWLKYIPSWFPGASFQRDAKHILKTLEDMVQLPYDYTKQQIASGTAQSSFVSTLLEAHPDEETIIKWSAQSLYAGASDTTVSAIYACFLAMILFPEVALKAQTEIDAVVGSERLPTFEDRPHLPYINAMVKEVLRWNNVTPLGGPRRSMEDSVYEGYFIPTGSIIITNIWKMSHDENIYSDPMAFNPERFLGSDPEPDPMDIVFGFGRRSCPGMHFADTVIYIGCAMCLAVFNVSKSVDPASGEVITPEYQPLPGIVSHPAPYQCTIKPRSAKAASLILQTDM